MTSFPACLGSNRRETLHLRNSFSHIVSMLICNLGCGDSLPNCQNVVANGLCTDDLPWADYGCRKSCGRCGFHDGN